jgi:protocatechuate 3,4-dioxygenase beta subunit
MTKPIPDPILRMSPWARRAFLRTGLVLPALWASAGALLPTPAVADPDDATPHVGEGPFFRPRSPERTTLLEPGASGMPFELTGRVLATDGAPIAGAIVDFWHSDAAGSYDTSGNRFRGHQRTDADGRYVLRSIVPGAYGGMAKHFHVKLAGGGRALTTRLEFAEDAQAFRLDPRLLIRSGGVGQGRFDFVLG